MLGLMCASFPKGGNMAKESSDARLSAMNRRQMLGTGVGLMGGAVAGISRLALAQEKPRPAAKAPAAVTGSNLNPPVVTVKGGKLRGIREGKTYSFLGIRYAEAERFGQPKPVQPWEGIRNAQAWGPCCPIPAQTTVGSRRTGLSASFLDPERELPVSERLDTEPSPAVKKPVMVWMHGGGFTNGSSMEAYAYDGRSLSEFGDVVVVSVNHRLNILGTLDLSAYGPEYANSRHTGMADLVASLEWVHDNIEALGGDPGNVMIFGQSGGGGKVVRLMHMPAAKGLFHKVSAQSGSALSRHRSGREHQTQQALAAATLKNLNLTGSQIDKLKTVPYLALLAAGTAAASRRPGVGRPAVAGTPSRTTSM